MLGTTLFFQKHLKFGDIVTHPPLPGRHIFMVPNMAPNQII